MSDLRKGIFFMVFVSVVMIVVPMLEHGMSFSEPETVMLASIGIITGLFGGFIFFLLLLVLLIVTASRKQRQDAQLAIKMGEHGVGTWMFGEIK